MKKQLIMLMCVLSWMATVLPLSAGTKSKIEVVWGVLLADGGQLGGLVKKSLTSRDLDGDGQKEKLIIASRIGASQNGHSLYIYRDGKQVGEVSFAFGEGCAIGPITSPGQQQVAVWHTAWTREEGKWDKHKYHVYVYGWDNGCLVESYFYATRQKYVPRVDEKVLGPWLEFLQHRQEAVRMENLQAAKPSAGVLQKLLQLGLKQNVQRNTLSGSAQVGPWLILGRYKSVPGATDWDGQIDAWQNVKGQWVNLAYGVERYSDWETAAQLRMPVSVWHKLWSYYRQ